MARKTPAKVIALIDRHNQRMDHLTEVLRVKRTVPVENQANHVREKSEDYWIGVAHGSSNALEEVLHEHGCYAGFHYVGESKPFLSDGSGSRPWVGPDHPEYESWRVQYNTRG